MECSRYSVRLVVPRFVPAFRRNGSQEVWNYYFLAVLCGSPTVYAFWFEHLNAPSRILATSSPRKKCEVPVDDCRISGQSIILPMKVVNIPFGIGLEYFLWSVEHGVSDSLIFLGGAIVYGLPKTRPDSESDIMSINMLSLWLKASSHLGI